MNLIFYCPSIYRCWSYGCICDINHVKMSQMLSVVCNESYSSICILQFAMPMVGVGAGYEAAKALGAFNASSHGLLY